MSENVHYVGRVKCSNNPSSRDWVCTTLITVHSWCLLSNSDGFFNITHVWWHWLLVMPSGGQWRYCSGWRPPKVVETSMWVKNY